MDLSYLNTQQIIDPYSIIWNHEDNCLQESIAIIDVREEDEFSEGYIKGAQNKPSGNWSNINYVQEIIKDCIDNKVSTVVIHCFNTLHT